VNGDYLESDDLTFALGWGYGEQVAVLFAVTFVIQIAIELNPNGFVPELAIPGSVRVRRIYNLDQSIVLEITQVDAWGNLIIDRDAVFGGTTFAVLDLNYNRGYSFGDHAYLHTFISTCLD
jgi:hypothetical protein